MHKTIYPCFLDELDSNKVNCSDGNENSFLDMAVKTLQPEMCQILLKCGANVEPVNNQGNSPIFELFENMDEIIKIANILIDSGVTSFESASKFNSERLMIYLLSKCPDLNIVTKSDFYLAFTNAWFVYAKDLVHLMPEDLMKSFISTDIFQLSMTHADPKLLELLFIKASSDVQQSVIEDLLLHFATNDEDDAFIKLLETKIIEPKLFTNGETLFTSLLKDQNVKYCWAFIHHAVNRNCFNLANASNKIPLQVAIKTELYDLITPLVYKCDQLNNEDIDGNTPLGQLFQKLSISTDISTKEKLMTAVRTIISRGGDIYKETSTGIKIIEFCSRLALRSEMEAFHEIERNREARVNETRIERNICNICLDRELDCVFECGHTLCTPCIEKLLRCPMCNAELKSARQIFI